MRVLIVGAGPTGLTAAVELARRGIIPEIVEKRKDASSLSRAVGILPVSLKLLEPAGVFGSLLEEGMKFRHVRIFDRTDRILDLPLDAAAGGAFILGLPQDRTEHHLIQALSGLGVSIRYDTELTGLDQDADRVVARFADRPSQEFDHLVAADGAHSTVREVLGLEFPGHDLPETWSIADVDASGWPYNDAFTLCRLPRGEVAVVAPLEETRYRVISNTEDALITLPLPLSVTRVRREGQFRISVRQLLQYRIGRVFFAGDAAHCHSPVGGRGMNLGIADAACLAHCLATGELDRYGPERHGAGRATIKASERARKLITATNPLTRLGFRLAVALVRALPPLRRGLAQRFLYD